MKRWVIAAQLKPDGEGRAAEPIARGHPYDLAGAGVVRESVHLSAKEALLVFEGEQSDSGPERLTRELRQSARQRPVDWGVIGEEAPRIVHEQFRWEVDETELGRLRRAG